MSLDLLAVPAVCRPSAASKANRAMRWAARPNSGSSEFMKTATPTRFEATNEMCANAPG
jgi:hypothetical protein